MDEPFLAPQLVSTLHYFTWVNYMQLVKLLNKKNDGNLSLNLYKTISEYLISYIHFRAAW